MGNGVAQGAGRSARSTDFDLLQEISPANSMVLTRTDRLPLYGKVDNKNPSYYKKISEQFVGNCENWVFAQSGKDWYVTTAESSLCLLKVRIAECRE